MAGLEWFNHLDSHHGLQSVLFYFIFLNLLPCTPYLQGLPEVTYYSFIWLHCFRLTLAQHEIRRASERFVCLFAGFLGHLGTSWAPPARPPAFGPAPWRAAICERREALDGPGRAGRGERQTLPPQPWQAPPARFLPRLPNLVTAGKNMR